jgi:4-hydroxybenzoate polyprenyltransferase
MDNYKSKIGKLLKILNTLSIDVSLGAMACSLFFFKVFTVKTDLISGGTISLGVTVWLIYTIDHVLDARRIKSTASTDRHRFHQKNITSICYVIAVISSINFVLLFFLPLRLLENGLWLAVGVVIYLALQKTLYYFKELLAALLYSAGILIGSISLASMPLQLDELLLIVHFTITVFIGLLLFSYFDHSNDKQDGQQSFSTLAGKKNTVAIIIVLLIINFILATIIAIACKLTISATITILSINLGLLTILLKRNYFLVNDRYRLIGDALFFIPIISVWW